MKVISKETLKDGIEIELIDSVWISQNPVEAITEIAGLSFNKEKVKNPQALFEYLQSESAGKPSSVLEFAWNKHLVSEKEISDEDVIIYTYHKMGGFLALMNLRNIFNRNYGFNIDDVDEVEIRRNIFTFKLKIPLWMFAQFVRHRKASYMSISRRRVKDIDSYEFYKSERSMDVETYHKFVVNQRAYHIPISYDTVIDILMEIFLAKLEAGEPLEVASRIFPQNLFANVYIQYTNTEKSWKNFVALRCDNGKKLGETHTQLETCVTARTMEKMLNTYLGGNNGK